MKKRILLLAVIFALILTSVSCSKPTETNSEPEAVTELTAETVTDEPTPETTPTPEVTAAPTPDANPMEKMQLLPEEMDKLVHYWSLGDINVEDQGELMSFSVYNSYDQLSLNYLFEINKSENEVKAEYAAALNAEWTTQDYQAGCLIEGNTPDNVTVLAQLADGELYVFISYMDKEKVTAFMDLVDSKCPVGLVPMHESFDVSNSRTFDYTTYDMIVNYSISYPTSESYDALIEYYKETLSSYDNYEAMESYDGTEMIFCSYEGVDITINYDEYGPDMVFNYGFVLNE